MKKLLMSMGLAVAAWVASADTVPSYLALSWKVQGTDIVRYDAKYVNLYATPQGSSTHINGDGRSSFGAGDVNVTATSIIEGVGGWSWGDNDPQTSTFYVELLNGDLGVIATSEGVSYDALTNASALEVNYLLSGIPQNGTNVYLFTNYTVDDDGIYVGLTNLYADVADVLPQTDANGVITNYLVTLKSSVTVPFQIPDNVGTITLDLNGYSIAGTNAVYNTASVGGNAIEIAMSLTLDSGADGSPTHLIVVNRAIKGNVATVAGGDGADGAQGSKGGYAIMIDPAVSNVVTVTIGDAKTQLLGGNSGDSSVYEGVAGSWAVSNDSSIGTKGDDGFGVHVWGWCICTYDGTLPAGTTQDGDYLKFWKRTSSTNGTGAAIYDFGVLAGQVIEDATIHLVTGQTVVAQFTVPSTVANLTFAGEDETTTLLSGGTHSIFNVTSSENQMRSWTNIVFCCDVNTWFSGNGGAINVSGGAITVADCVFTNCLAGSHGGAINASMLQKPSTIVDTYFVDNAAGLESYGGAIYATAKSSTVADRLLTITNCCFIGNSATDGGAICTVTDEADDELPIKLAIFASTFDGNKADFGGGAIEAEGDLVVDEGATYNNKGTTVFRNNFAGRMGGAVLCTGILGDTDPITIALHRGVQFLANTVSNAQEMASGGAIDVRIPETAFTAEGVAFIGNTVYGNGDWGAVGGAVYRYWEVAGGSFKFDTCIFNTNRVFGIDSQYYTYGGSIMIDGGASTYADTLLKNCTFRNSNVDAVTVQYGTISITNCVAVGNATDLTGDDKLDLILYADTNEMAYSAYGKIAADPALASDVGNLTNRVAASVYADADTLKLRSTGFNPVAALGLVQGGVYDFDAVEYGSYAIGSSMGAYETLTEPVLVHLSGTKTYDGSADTNGCAWTWEILATNGTSIAADCADLGDDISQAFVIASWAFGSKEIGSYDSYAEAPNNIVASLDAATDMVQRWMDYDVFLYHYDGSITERPIEEGGFDVIFNPNEYRWTGERVLANVTVKDSKSGETLQENVDYRLEFSNNIDPTDQATATVTALRNYTGTTNVYYLITAYLVEYCYDGVPNDDMTKIYGETSGVYVVVDPAEIPAAPAQYAWDYQWSPTNGTVTTYTDGLLRLKVNYYTDSNSDGIPDIYQRKILAKVVHGEWSKNVDGSTVKNGSDQTIWTTLMADDKWSTNGTTTVTTSLAAGTRAETGYSAGGWLAFVNGKLTQVDLSTFTVDNATVPFLIYAYNHYTSRTGGKLSGKGSSGSSTQAALADQYGATFKVADATLDSGTLKIKTQLIVKDATTNAQLADVPVNNTVLNLYMTETLGDDWQKTNATTDDDGCVVIPLSRKSGFYKVGL